MLSNLELILTRRVHGELKEKLCKKIKKASSIEEFFILTKHENDGEQTHGETAQNPTMIKPTKLMKLLMALTFGLKDLRNY